MTSSLLILLGSALVPDESIGGSLREDVACGGALGFSRQRVLEMHRLSRAAGHFQGPTRESARSWADLLDVDETDPPPPPTPR